jgi:hypothetical protein
MLGYDSGGDSGKVLGSDSGKKSGTILSKTQRLGKKSGKELPDRVETQVRRPDKTKICETRRLLCFE